jgi:hypothetical protein
MDVTRGPTSAPFNSTALAGATVTPTGGTTGGTLSALLAEHSVNVKRYGAKATGRVAPATAVRAAPA